MAGRADKQVQSTGRKSNHANSITSPFVQSTSQPRCTERVCRQPGWRQAGCGSCCAPRTPDLFEPSSDTCCQQTRVLESHSLAKELPRLHTGVAPPEATSRAGNLPGTGNRRWDRYSTMGIVEFENSLLGAGTADGVRIFFNYNTATGAAQRSSNEQGVPVTVYNTNRTWTGHSSNYYVLQLQNEQAAQANATFDVTESPFDVVRTYNPENTD
jgi:hypothetical protein